MAEVSGAPAPRVVPGVVRLMTKHPVEIRGTAMAPQSPVAEAIEERPWLVAVAILCLLGLLLAVRRR